MNKFFIIKAAIALAIATLIMGILIIIFRVSQYNIPLWCYYLLMLLSLISAGSALVSMFPLRKQSINIDHLQANNTVSGVILTRENLDLEEKRLELEERYLNLEKARANYTLEMAHKLTNTLSSEADTQAREKLLDAFIEQFIRSQQRESWPLSQSEGQGNREAVPEE